jgi:hypothetical protein
MRECQNLMLLRIVVAFRQGLGSFNFRSAIWTAFKSRPEVKPAHPLFGCAFSCSPNCRRYW